MRTFRIFLTLLLFTALTTAIVAATAQANTPAIAPGQSGGTITMVIEGGFNSYTKSSAWLPLRITLENAGEPLEGELVLVNEKTAESLERYAQPVTLAKAARRQVTMYVPASASSYEVRLMVAGQVVATATPLIRQLADNDRLIVVVSDPPDAFNFLGDLSVPYGGRTLIALMQPAQLPDRTAAFDSADVLVFNNVDTSTLSQAQRNAIKGWIVAGGSVLLNGGPGAGLTLSGFTDIAPARPSQGLIGGSPLAFRQFIAPSMLGPMPDDLILNVPSVVLELNPHAKTLISAKETALIARREFGRGRVDQLAFDATLAPMRDWPGRSAVFGALIGGRVDLPSAIGALREDALPGQTASALPAAALPSILLVGGFLMLYVLVIGPFNYLILRRFRRLSWAWITIPSIVIAFTLAGVLTGFRLRGNAAQLHRLNLVMGDSRMAEARSFTLLGLFAPRRAEVDVDMGHSLAEQVADVRTPRSISGDAWFSVGDPSVMHNLLIGGSDVRSLYARSEASLPPIETNLTFVPPVDDTRYGELRGTVRNLSNVALKECTLFSGRDYQVFGDLPAQATVNASVSFFLGKPQPAMNLRNARLGRDRYYRGPYYYRSLRSGRSSTPPSSSTTGSSTTSAPPFDLRGDPTTSGLVNWKDFARNSLAQEAEHGLVFATVGDERIGTGAYVSCWTDSVTNDISVQNAEYTDRSVLIWQVPVQGALAGKDTWLPPDIFTWDLVASSTSAGFIDEGLSLEAGQHIIDISPWFDLRTTSSAISLTLGTAFEGTSNTALQNAVLYAFDWREQKYVALTETLRELADTDRFGGAYLSPAGSIRLRIDVNGDAVTLSDLVPQVQVLE